MNYCLNLQYFAASSLSTAYCLNDLNRQQQEQIKRHISAQDYFGTLATVLSMMMQYRYHSKHKREQLFNELLDELEFLQEHYHITQKKK